METSRCVLLVLSYVALMQIADGMDDDTLGKVGCTFEIILCEFKTTSADPARPEKPRKYICMH